MKPLYALLFLSTVSMATTPVVKEQAKELGKFVTRLGCESEVYVDNQAHFCCVVDNREVCFLLKKVSE